MAYPTVSAPYGFHPINRVDGTPYAGQTRLIPIASTYNTAIFYGDLVKIVAAGTIEKFTGTTTGSPSGVFVVSSTLMLKASLHRPSITPALALLSFCYRS